MCVGGGGGGAGCGCGCGQQMIDCGPKALAHPEGARLYPRALKPIQADVQDFDARRQPGQSCQPVLWEDQSLQSRQQVEGVVVDGGDEVAGEVNLFQFC